MVALPGARPAQLRQVRERGLPARHREAREAVLLEAEIDRARRGQLDRGRQSRRPGSPRRRCRVGRPQPGQLRARLEVRLPVRPAQVAERVERPAVPDGGQDVRQLAVLGASVVDVVGDDDREAERLGQRRRFRHEPVVVGQQMVRQLDEEAAGGRSVAPPEQRRVAFRDGPRPGPVARPQATDQLAVPAARQRDEPVGVLGQQRLAEARDGLGPGHVRVRHEPAQAPPADLRSGEQDQVRPADPLDDPAQVLLDRGADDRATGCATAGGGRAGLRSRRAAGGHRADREPPGRSRHDPALLDRRIRDDASGGAGRRSRPDPRRPDRAARSRVRRPGGVPPPRPRSRNGPPHTARRGP